MSRGCREDHLPHTEFQFRILRHSGGLKLFTLCDQSISGCSAKPASCHVLSSSSEFFGPAVPCQVKVPTFCISVARRISALNDSQSSATMGALGEGTVWRPLTASESRMDRRDVNSWVESFPSYETKVACPWKNSCLRSSRCKRPSGYTIIQLPTLFGPAVGLNVVCHSEIRRRNDSERAVEVCPAPAWTVITPGSTTKRRVS